MVPEMKKLKKANHQMYFHMVLNFSEYTHLYLRY